MSYDILIYTQDGAPHDPSEFEIWYTQILEGEEQEFEKLDEKLKVFFSMISQEFPTISSFNRKYSKRRGILGLLRQVRGTAPPHATPFEVAKVTDYSFAKGAILAHFDFRLADFASARVHSASQFAEVEYFNLSKESI